MVTTLPEQAESQVAGGSAPRAKVLDGTRRDSGIGRTLLVACLACSGLGLVGWAGWALAFDGPSTNAALIF